MTEYEKLFDDVGFFTQKKSPPDKAGNMLNKIIILLASLQPYVLWLLSYTHIEDDCRVLVSLNVY